MSEYLSTIEEETKNITGIAYEMGELSRAFYATGNMAMGETLDFASRHLLEAQKNISTAVAVDINDRFKVAEQSAQNTIAACLSMIETNK